MVVLKLLKSNEKKEIDFELNYLMSLTTKQRFELMFEKSRQMARMLKKEKGRKAVIIKRSKDGTVEKIFRCRWALAHAESQKRNDGLKPILPKSSKT
jgi:hypothetical protein